MTETIATLNALPDYLRTHIRGQDHVIARMCSVVTRAELRLHPADQPKTSVLFLGPTGVGKTELTKHIASSFLARNSSIASI
jgi:ATP-dependent Clp protease ATP-binding subunit ClpC